VIRGWLQIWVVDSTFVTCFGVKIVWRVIHKTFSKKLWFLNILSIFIFLVFLWINFHNIWEFLRFFVHVTIFDWIDGPILRLPFKGMIYLSIFNSILKRHKFLHKIVLSGPFVKFKSCTQKTVFVISWFLEISNHLI